MLIAIEPGNIANVIVFVTVVTVDNISASLASICNGMLLIVMFSPLMMY